LLKVLEAYQKRALGQAAGLDDPISMGVEAVLQAKMWNARLRVIHGRDAVSLGKPLPTVDDHLTERAFTLTCQNERSCQEEGFVTFLFIRKAYYL
jgi:hypothetical protein